MPAFLRVVQLTDTHLFADPTRTLLGLNTQDSFDAVLDLLRAQPWRADLLLLTGDLAQDEAAPTYQRLAHAVDALEIPTYWLPGNHDDYAAMQVHLQGTHWHADKVITRAPWQIILLNTQLAGEVPGQLAAAELDFLETTLRACTQPHVLLCLHHPPVAVGCAWVDAVGLQNAAALFAVLARYPHVRCIISGHIHQEFASTHQNIAIYTAPSTCFQFKPLAQKFKLDKQPPGLRYLALHADGSIVTEVMRAQQFTGHRTIDTTERGY